MAKSPSQATRGKKRVNFTFRGAPGSRVYLAGDFNNWSTSAKELKDRQQEGKYRATLYLAPGVYEYKLVVDGVWCVDPSCREWTKNPVGSLNSILRVTA